MKTCRRCGDDKPTDAFRVRRRVQYADAPEAIYRSAWCRRCEREYACEWRQRNPGYHAAKSRGYRQMKV